MNENVMPLLVLCIVTAVVGGVIVIQEPSSNTRAVKASISEINSNPSAWVDKTVALEGKLSGPSVHIPESHPPWNYTLFGPNETIATLGTPETVAIGVLWNSRDHYAFQNTTVVGVVRKGRWAYLW